MATALKLRRGTTVQHSTFTGAEGEVTVDTTKDTVVVHDGSTAGGFPLARESGSTIAVSGGTVSAPGLTASGDPNTGIYFPAADTIAFAEGGVESMRIDSAGNVYVGKTSLSGNTVGHNFEAVGTANHVASGATPLLLNRLASAGSILDFRQGSGNNVGNISVTSTATSYNTSTASGLIGVDATTVAINTNSAERMRITSAGEVLVGGTTSLNASSGAMSLQAAGGGSFNLFRNDTSVVSGDFFGAINFWGNDTTSNTPTAHAYIGATASGTHAAGDNPTDLVFATTPDGSATVTERMRITSAGDVLVASANAGARTLSVYNSDTGAGSYSQFYVQTNAGYLIQSIGSTANGALSSIYSTGSGGMYQYTVGAYPLYFGTNSTERMRINSSGNVFFTKTASDLTSAGMEYATSGRMILTTATNLEPLILNRQASDGTLIEFRQANTTEGSISVSGTTVSYNGGNLSRWAQMPGTKDDTLVKGTVMSNLDEMNVYVKPTLYWTEDDELPMDEEGNPTVAVGDVKKETSVSENEQLNKVKVSDVEGDVNVAGVFVNWTYDDAHQVDEINMAMTGDMIIRIAQGVVVQKGDLLMSAGDGTAKPQGDDIVRSKTVAKVTSNHITCTYADGSYCVPCVLMAC
jgi:hypothetical protein